MQELYSQIEFLSPGQSYCECFEIATDYQFNRAYASLCEQMKNGSASTDELSHSREYFGFLSRVVSRYRYAVYAVIPDPDDSDIALEQYILCDENRRPCLSIINAQLLYTTLYEGLNNQEFANLTRRLGPRVGKAYDYGLQLLKSGKKTVDQTVLFLSEAYSTIIVPINEADARKYLPDSRNFKASELREIAQCVVLPIFEGLCVDTNRISTKLALNFFIAKQSQGDEYFGAIDMRLACLSYDDLQGEERDEFLRNGLIVNHFHAVNSEKKDIVEYIQLLEGVLPFDEFQVGFVYYDLTMPDSTHYWMCKFDWRFSDLLSEYDYNELNSKLPNLTQAYENAIFGNFEEGLLMQTPNAKTIYVKTYRAQNAGDINKFHMQCIDWLKQTVMQVVRFQKYVEIKAKREQEKSDSSQSTSLNRMLTFKGIEEVIRIFTS